MSESDRSRVTQLLRKWSEGEEKALDELAPLVYEQLRRLARRHMRGEREGHTLQTTALVNEAYLHLAGSDTPFQDRVHFFAIASRVMRRILVDHARARRSAKRGGGAPRLPLDEARAAAGEPAWDAVDLDLALDALAGTDERKARVIEMHYFGGMTHDEIAAALRIPASSVNWDIRLGRAWLRRHLASPPERS